MKRVICLIIGLVFTIFIITIIPNISNNIAEATSNNNDIIGTWTRELDERGHLFSLQFKSDGKLIMYKDLNTIPSYAAEEDKFENKLKEFTYSYNYNNNELTVDGEKYYCSIEGNGMITTVLEAYGIRSNSNAIFIRA